MFRKTASALALSASFLVAGFTGNASAQYATQVNYNGNAGMGGGFIEFLFGGHQQQQSPYQQPHQTPQYAPQPYQQPAVSAAAVSAAAAAVSAAIPARLPAAGPYQQQAPYQQEPAYQEQRQQAYAPAEPARHSVDPKFNKQVVAYSRSRGGGHHRHRYAEQVSLSRAGQRQRGALRHRRRPPGLHLGRGEDHFDEEGMAVVDAAGGDAEAPARPAALHGRRPGKSARRARDVSRLARSIASTARTSPGRSARRCRRAASACATRT